MEARIDKWNYIWFRFNSNTIFKEFKGALEINNSKEDVKVTGLLRKIYKPNIFKPENDLKKNIWFSVNLKDVKTLTGVQFNNFIIYLEDQKATMPVPKKITINMSNNHLKYAITWYSIAISVLFYYLYFREKKWIILVQEISQKNLVLKKFF